MSPKRSDIVWKAEAHTIAKIAILKSYLYAWFHILGGSPRSHNLLYIDGVAGPGRYTNHSEGSPTAALVAAREVLGSGGVSRIANTIDLRFYRARCGRGGPSGTAN